MKFSYNILKKFVATQMPPEKLAELLTFHLAEVDDIEKVGDDHIFDIKILYNRGDLVSHRNLAKEVAALTGSKLKDLDYKVQEDKSHQAQALLGVTIHNPKLASRYSARIVEDVTIGPSPKWLKEVLESVGIRSVNNVVDCTNYVMLEYGQPMHAFDYAKITGKKIEIRNAKVGEEIELLDENIGELELSDDVLVIADGNRPLALGGIKGGIDSGISNSTSSIVLESAMFDGPYIRRASTALGIRTDASIRFQYGLDPNQTVVALNRCAMLIKEVTGGRIAQGVLDAYPNEVTPWTVVVKHEYVNSLLGTEIPEAKISSILSDLGMPSKISEGKISVTVPTYRRDVKTPEDIVEEIGRMYGYENIEAKPPMIFAFPESHAHRKDIIDMQERVHSRRLIKEVLKGMAFNEAYTYTFISNDTKEIFAINDAPELLNPVSSEYRFMRPSLVPNLLIAAKNNLRFYSDIHIFEIGNVFEDKDGEIKEWEQIAGIVVSKNLFQELKGTVESLFNHLGIPDIEFVERDDPPHKGRHWYHPGKGSLVKSGDTVLGTFGVTHPVVSKRLGIKGNIEMGQFCFNFDRVFDAVESNLEFEPIPKYPSIIRDISILVPKDARISQILNVINDTDDTSLIQDVDVFDIFESHEKDLKSVAFHVIYRSNDRTLKDSEVDSIEKSIKKALGDKLGAIIK